MKHIAIITTHPIQYHAPWFRHLAKESDLRLKVFYLADFGVTEKPDVGFGRSIRWDIPLLSGYEYEFIPNVSRKPGTHHFHGLNNPKLFEKVKDYDPDAVLLIGYHFASYRKFISQWRGRRAPLLFRGDSHRLIPQSGLKAWMRRSYISSVFHRFEAFLYVGEANRQYFLMHRVPPSKLFFAPHAVDNERFFAAAEKVRCASLLWKQELGIPTNHAVVLFAGKFEDIKRPLDLLRAFTRAALRGVSLLFVGNGHLETELRNEARGRDHIHFAPFQNQSLMPRTYAASDLFVLPSHQETWGLAINEAMCLSCPIIASSQVGCAQDLVKQRVNGLVFPAGDVDALANSLRTAFSDRQRLKQWGEESCNMIRNYSYIQTTQGFRSALLGILEKDSSVVSSSIAD